MAEGSCDLYFDPASKEANMADNEERSRIRNKLEMLSTAVNVVTAWS